MNMGMGNQINQMGASGSGVSGTPVGQYNPQMLIQQPYLNFTPFNVNYANNQVRRELDCAEKNRVNLFSRCWISNNSSI